MHAREGATQVKLARVLLNRDIKFSSTRAAELAAKKEIETTY